MRKTMIAALALAFFIPSADAETIEARRAPAR